MKIKELKKENVARNQQHKSTFSKAMDAVNPDVSIATTAGSGLATGRMCFEGT